MFIRKYGPVYAPETEIGADDGAGGTPPPVPQKDDGPGSGRTPLRKALESSIQEINANNEEQEKERKRSTVTKGTGKAPKSRARQELEAQEEADDELLEPAEGEEQQPQEQDGEQAESQYEPPAAWTKEAKAEWAAVPAKAQQAILKRELDFNKGVEQLKKSYADIDAVIQPRLPILKEMGKTPGEAINQLFMWMDALGQDPARVQAGQPPVALIALAHSFGLQIPGLTVPLNQQQQQEQGEEGADGAEVPQGVKQYISQLEGRLAQFEQQVQGGFQNFQQTFQQQQFEKTNAVMDAWAKDKPYFEDVRRDMAYIIGSHMIPPKEDGTADLDKAYDMALYANPQVREKVLSDRRKAALEKRKKAQEAEAAAQQAAANKARRASTTLGPSAPGNTLAGEQPGKKKQRSVRESLAEAIEELGG